MKFCDVTLSDEILWCNPDSNKKNKKKLPKQFKEA